MLDGEVHIPLLAMAPMGEDDQTADTHSVYILEMLGILIFYFIIS